MLSTCCIVHGSVGMKIFELRSVFTSYCQVELFSGEHLYGGCQVSISNPDVSLRQINSYCLLLMNNCCGHFSSDCFHSEQQLLNEWIIKNAGDKRWTWRKIKLEAIWECFGSCHMPNECPWIYCEKMLSTKIKNVICRECYLLVHLLQNNVYRIC